MITVTLKNSSEEGPFLDIFGALQVKHPLATLRDLSFSLG